MKRNHHAASASPAGRQTIAHRFIGGYGRARGASPARDGRVLSSLTGLVARPTRYPPMNRWAMVFRPAGLPEIRVTRCRRDRPHSKRFAHCTNSWRDVSSRAILWTLIPAALLLLPWLQAQGEAAPAAKLTIQVDKPGHKIPPTLWGIFFEDINLSADGGI